MSNKKLNKKIISDEDIQKNIEHHLVDFEYKLRELFGKWINNLSAEEIIAHIEWVNSEKGREYLNENSHIVASNLFNYMDFAYQRFEDDLVNADFDWDLANSLNQVLEEEVVVQT